MSTVESQEGKPVCQCGDFGYSRNGFGNWDRLRLAQPGSVFAYDEERRLWPVEGGKTRDPLKRDAD